MGNEKENDGPRRPRKRIRGHDDDEEDYEGILEMLEIAERFLEEQIQQLDRATIHVDESTDDEADETDDTDETDETDEITEIVEVMDDGSIFTVPVRENVKKEKRHDDINGVQVVPNVDGSATVQSPEIYGNLTNVLLDGASTSWRLDPTGGLFIERIMNLVSNTHFSEPFEEAHLNGNAFQGASLNHDAIFLGENSNLDDTNFEDPTDQQSIGSLADNSNVAEHSNENDSDENK